MGLHKVRYQQLVKVAIFCHIIENLALVTLTCVSSTENFGKAAVISKIFTRVLFLQNFASGKFRESKTLAKCEITISFTDIDKSWSSREFLTWQICLGSIHENKILAKISEFTVYSVDGAKIFQYCTCPAGRVTYNFYASCKPMHLSFKRVCNKEHKGVNRTALVCYMTS